MSFDPLIEKILALRNPSVLGLDPRVEYVPEAIRERAARECSGPLEAAAAAIYAYNRALIDAARGIMPAVKPQSAYYEALGLHGLACLQETMKYAREAGMYVILDVKRGDIGATAQAYAEAYLGAESAFGADCITVNPYLGSDGVMPFVDMCAKNDKAIFVLVKTSNPSAGEFQDIDTSGIPLYRRVADKVKEWGEGGEGVYGYTRVGAVVGATYPRQLVELREALPRTFFLIPGYGAQGGKASDIKAAFDAKGVGAIVNNSRGIMCAYMNKSDPQNFITHVRDAMLEMKRELGF